MSPRPSTCATSSASPSAAPSSKPAPSSSPTTRARARAKASRASPTCRPCASARAISRRATPWSSDPLTGQPFPGNVIPEDRQSAIGRRIAALYPAPNRDDPFQNFVSSPVQRDRNDSFDVRLDHLLSARSDLVFRYSFNDRDLFEPFSGPTFSLVPGYGVNIPRRSQNVMLGETHIFTPAFINEARVAFNRVALGVFQESSGTSVNRAVGLPELSDDPRDFGLSFITVAGFSPLGDECNNPQHSATNTFQFLDTATYVRGGHLMKFGGDIRLVQQNAFRDVQSRGFLTFSPFAQITGNALADLLLGLPAPDRRRARGQRAAPALAELQLLFQRQLARQPAPDPDGGRALRVQLAARGRR